MVCIHICIMHVCMFYVWYVYIHRHLALYFVDVWPKGRRVLVYIALTANSMSVVSSTSLPSFTSLREELRCRVVATVWNRRSFLFFSHFPHGLDPSFTLNK